MAHIWVSHGTHMSASWHTYECVMAHIWVRHGTHMSASWHTYEWVVQHIWVRHGTHMSESYNTYGRVMAHIWVSPVTRNMSRTQDESYHTGTRHKHKKRNVAHWSESRPKYVYKYDSARRGWRFVTLMSYEQGGTCPHTSNWVISHIWVSYVANVYMRMGDSSHKYLYTYEWVMSQLCIHMIPLACEGLWVMSHIWWVMSNICMSHVTNISESCHSWVSHVTHMILLDLRVKECESWHRYERVMS